MTIEIGSYGVWRTWPELAELGEARLTELGGTLETAGYRTLWLGMAQADLAPFEPVLAGTTRMVAATGIANIWTVPAEALGAAYHRVSTAYPDRVLLGVGAGHPEANQDYRKPYESVQDYLEELYAEQVPAEAVMLAALGPKVLELAGGKTAGAHPYLVSPEHTARARQILGPQPVLAPEQKVVLETDPGRARQIARDGIGFYLELANYRANLLRLGFTEEEMAGGGSDRLVDALVAWGSVEQIAERLAEHHRAGANHVGVQVLTGSPGFPLDEYIELATALG